MSTVSRSVRNFFNDNHLSCQEDWLQSCLDYFLTNNPNGNFESCRDFALEQWKLGNLREIGVPTFPNSNLKAVKVTELKGIYSVQIEKFWDKANSTYNQYKNYKGELGDEPQNEEDNENEIDVTEWGKGPSAGETKRTLKPRRLLMEICDGQTELKALEWRPIQELSGMVYPGAKMVIKGPVTCRNGILMLGPEHIKLYGGEVDDYIFKNAMENLIADSLNMPLNNDPYNGKLSTLPPPRKPQPKKSQWQPRQQQTSSYQPPSNFSNPAVPTSNSSKSTNHIGNSVRPNNNFAGRPQTSNATRTNTNFFNNPDFTKKSSPSSSLTSPTLRGAKKPEIQVDASWDEELDDFELSAEDLLQIESVEQQQSQKVQRKRQTASPTDFNLEEDEMDEILRLEEEARKAKRPHIEVSAQPTLARVKPIVKNVVPPVQEKTSTSGLQKTPNLRNFLNKASVPFPRPESSKLRGKAKLSKRPFMYLIQLQDKWRKKATVKATIMTLLKKLHTTNQRWSLSVRITDSTAFLDVDLGNRVLCKLIGMKCKNVSGLTVDKDTKKKMMQGLKNKLIDCDCLMVLKFRNHGLPKVIKFKKVNHTHLEQLRNRRKVLCRP